MDIKLFFTVFIAFLVLVNPLQKIFVVITLQNNYTGNELRKIINWSNLTALGVLVLFLFLGERILTTVFNLKLYAFQVTCGVVLLYNGFMGLQKGAFLAVDRNSRIEDVIAVPIAIPMIAGPATITAVVLMPSMYGKTITVAAVTLAIGINFLIMRNAIPIAKWLTRFNALMPMIRVTGLIIAAIGMQMVFNGITAYISLR